jgi:hypothetical protein
VPREGHVRNWTLAVASGRADPRPQCPARAQRSHAPERDPFRMDTSQMMKPEFIRAVREFASESLSDAYEPATILLHRLAAYEDADKLGGQECATMIIAMGNLQKALGLRQLPHDMTTTAWSFATF